MEQGDSSPWSGGEREDAAMQNSRGLDWQTRHKEYLQRLTQKNKAVQAQEVHAVEQMQRLKVKLAKRVLGESFERFGKLRAEGATANSITPPHVRVDSPGGTVGAASSDVDGTGSPHAPLLPPLADAGGEPLLPSGADTGSPCRRSTRRSTSLLQPSTAATSTRTHMQRPGQSRLPSAALPGGPRKRRTTLSNPMNPSSRELEQTGYAGAGSASDGSAGAAAGAGAGRDVSSADDQHLGHSHGSRAGGGAAGGGSKAVASSHKGHVLYQQARASQELQRVIGSGAGSGALTSAQAGYLQWRAKNGIPPGQRVFCMAGSGQHSVGIRQGLLARGWAENPDHNSLFFDFKWAANPLDINHDALWPGQVVNHYSKAHHLTTKHGLCHLLHDMVWFEAADWAAFYPRAYDITTEESRKDFLRDVRWTAAESLLQRAVLDGAVSAATTHQAPDGAKQPHAHPQAHPHTQPPAHAHAHPPMQAEPAHPAPHDGQEQSDQQQQAPDAAGTLDADPLPPKHHSHQDQPQPQPQVQQPPQQQQALHQHPRERVLVDLPCLKLAMRVVACRLRHQAYLRTDQQQAQGEGGAACASSAASAADDGPPPPLEPSLSAREWYQLVKHPALHAPADMPPPPPFDPSWLASRHFITSVRAPRSPAAGDNDCGSSFQQPPQPEGEQQQERQEGPALADQEPAGSSSGGAVTAQGPSPDAPGSAAAPPPLRPASASSPPAPPLPLPDAAYASLTLSDWRAPAEALVHALASSSVQSHISGTSNIWIVKPAGKSRGRGIRLFNDPDALLAYTRGDAQQSLEARWVAQKYVERPLVVQGRKFDIRQWVLVTDWNPLGAWFYGDCYLRFAADDYDPNCLDVFQHLTNNSVSKYYEGPVKDDDITSEGNMWSIPRFQRWLADTYGRDDLWQALLQPAMKHIAICTLKCAQDAVRARKGSCQLYGYDFLIDDQLRVWLLEVNASPTMEASTPITGQLCADVQEDILKVVVDMPDALAASRRRQADAPAAEPDCGKWQLILDGGEEVRTPHYTGCSLEVRGAAIGNGHGNGLRSSGTAAPLVPTAYGQQQQQQRPAPTAGVARRASLADGGGAPPRASHASPPRHHLQRITNTGGMRASAAGLPKALSGTRTQHQHHAQAECGNGGTGSSADEASHGIGGPLRPAGDTAAAAAGTGAGAGLAQARVHGPSPSRPGSSMGCTLPAVALAGPLLVVDAPSPRTLLAAPGVGPLAVRARVQPRLSLSSQWAGRVDGVVADG